MESTNERSDKLNSQLESRPHFLIRWGTVIVILIITIILSALFLYYKTKFQVS